MSASSVLADLEQLDERTTARHVNALDRLDEVLARPLEIPPPVTEVRKSATGTLPLLSAEAIELARQVYYLHHGSLSAAARAILAAGLAGEIDSEDPVALVANRLKTWWRRERWPKRPVKDTFLLRDAQAGGGLFRGRPCAGVGTGNGSLKRGQPCGQSALSDSEFCFQHDPRPEYVERRRVIGERFARARLRGLVDVGPFRDWLVSQQKRLLDEAAGGVHFNQRGGSLLANWLGVDQSPLLRVIERGHTSARSEVRSPGRIRAATVVAWLERSGTTFRDLYGFDPPPARDLSGETCPECGGRRSSGSQRCRDCYERSRAQCAYVNRRGERCQVFTAHESGCCSKCRRMLERRARPKLPSRRGRKSAVSARMLMLAAIAYLQLPRFGVVARRLWAANAAGCREEFRSVESLEGSLVNAFRRQGWTLGGDLRRSGSSRDEVLLAVGEGLAELEAEHGEIEFPAVRVAASEVLGAEIPIGPFRDWLTARHAEAGTFKALSERVGIADDRVAMLINRRGAGGRQTVVLRSTVERALELWGEGETLDDLYGDGRWS